MTEYSHHKTWALCDHEGELEEVFQGSLEKVWNDIVQAAGQHEVIVDAPDYMLPGHEHPERMAANDGSVLPMAPQKSLRAATLAPLDFDEVDRMDLREAHEALFPFMPTERKTHAGRRIKILAWSTPGEMASALFGTNYKMEKQATSRLRVSKGLLMVPHAQAFWQYPSPPSKEQLETARQAQTLCKFSTPECRATCLVYSGQALVDNYAYQIKMAKAMALVAQPMAFMRMVFEAARRHEKTTKRNGGVPYVRMNVFSDVPWEMLVPGMHERLRGLKWYDYTKVPGRSAKGYHLTFSYSGAKTSLEQCYSEFDAGKNIAVVFINMNRYLQRKKQKGAKLPKIWAGFSVIDGDKHDLRPLDRPNVAVGLLYKTPLHGADVSRYVPPKFVVACDEIDGRMVVAESPRATGASDFHEYESEVA